MAKYQVVGVEHMKGTSKRTGRPYDMDILHVIAEQTPRNVEINGKQVDKITISRDSGILKRAPMPGEVYDIGFTRSGFVDYADICNK